MRTILAVLLLHVALGSAFGQTEKPAHQAVTDQFVRHYNAGRYDSVFALFSATMQEALPPDKTTSFLAGLKAQAGNITGRQFIKYVNSTYASYKTTFERAVLAVNISVDSERKINGLLVKPFADDNLPTLVRNVTKLALPFAGEWSVTWGGDTKELNYHVESTAQRGAFDFVVTNAQGKSYRTDGKTNEDYYAFGQPLLAPCAAEVMLVVDGVKDNQPGVLNPTYVPGNTVILKTANNEYLFFAHFQRQSIRVKLGQAVTPGQTLGLCGNSGNSSEPHLHFHVQNVEDMNVATGAKCYFDKLAVNGQPRRDYSPIKGDKIKSE